MANIKDYMVTVMNAEGNICGPSVVISASSKPEIREKLRNYAKKTFIAMGGLSPDDKLPKQGDWDTDTFVKGTYYFSFTKCEDFYLLVEDIEDMTRNNNRLLGSLA
jgi:hypothetical protein